MFALKYPVPKLKHDGGPAANGRSSSVAKGVPAYGSWLGADGACHPCAGGGYQGGHGGHRAVSRTGSGGSE